MSLRLDENTSLKCCNLLLLFKEQPTEQLHQCVIDTKVLGSQAKECKSIY